jgi:AbrB family looped-hinge helix DNA binding protein
MYTSTLTTKGQITLPKALRDALRLHSGDKIIFENQGNGNVILKTCKATDVKILRGFLKYHGPAVSVEDMRDAIARMGSEEESQNLKTCKNI